MKRIFTISVAAVMALLMVLSLTACGNSTLGYYKLTSAEASGMSFDSSTLAAVGMDKGYILLKEDGKAKLSAAGQEQELTYDDKNFTADGESISYTLKDGVITMENNGAKISAVQIGLPFLYKPKNKGSGIPLPIIFIRFYQSERHSSSASTIACLSIC